MAPIRTAIIGLSSSSKTSWASAAHLPYLLSPRGKEKYEIVALCSSSIDAARRAIAHYNLPNETRAYGDPQVLANDPDIDLVVNCTRVDVHHPTILPSVKAGKKVFVEWPLAQDLAHVKDIVDAARSIGNQSMIGLQGRVAPTVLKIRQILEEGSIGKVLSTEVRAAGGSNDREVLPSGLKYFTDRSIGGNIYTIGFGHPFDHVQYVLGEVINPRAHLQVQRPNVKIRDPESKKIVEIVNSNVPDLIFTTASLPESKLVQAGASLLFRLRRGQPFPGEPALVWTIEGEKGEVRVISQDTISLAAFATSVNIQVHDFETDKVKEVEWSWEDWQLGLPITARGIGMLYDNFAAGIDVPNFEDAIKRHEQLEGMLGSWKP